MNNHNQNGSSFQSSGLRQKVDQLMDILWAGGVNNPMDSIEQLSYLIFLRLLTEKDETLASLDKKHYKRIFSGSWARYAWGNFVPLTGPELFTAVRSAIEKLHELPGLSATGRLLFNRATLKIYDPPTLRAVIQVIHEMDLDRRTADLIPALFHEMFGDPSVNPRHWPQRRLRELAQKYSDGPFGTNLKSSHYTRDGIRVLRLQNIGVGFLIDENEAYISREHFHKLQKHQCLPGDVIVGTLGDPILRACILPRGIPQAVNKADCVQIRPSPDLAVPEYICWLLNLPSTIAMGSGMIQGQTRARISMGRLAELVVPVPPLPLQKSFASRVAQIRDLEAKQSASRQRLDDLFQSTLHRAFGGEL